MGFCCVLCVMVYYKNVIKRPNIGIAGGKGGRGGDQETLKDKSASLGIRFSASPCALLWSFGSFPLEQQEKEKQNKKPTLIPLSGTFSSILFWTQLGQTDLSFRAVWAQEKRTGCWKRFVAKSSSSDFVDILYWPRVNEKRFSLKGDHQHET